MEMEFGNVAGKQADCGNLPNERVFAPSYRWEEVSKACDPGTIMRWYAQKVSSFQLTFSIGALFTNSLVGEGRPVWERI